MSASRSSDKTKAKGKVAATALEGKTETVNIDRVIPYWRNPRKITDEGIEAVRASIEAFGYLQPVVVDDEYVIIIGHTRYSAMRRMGLKEVQVVKVDLPPLKVKQLRVIDNKTHELAEWNHDMLRTELDRLGVGDDDVLSSLFKDAMFDPAKDLAATPEVVDPQREEKPVGGGGGGNVEFICPQCFYEWERYVSRDDALSDDVLTTETDENEEAEK